MYLSLALHSLVFSSSHNCYLLTNRNYVANGDVFLKGLVLSFAHFSGLIVALIRIVRSKILRSQKEVYVVLRIFFVSNVYTVYKRYNSFHFCFASSAFLNGRHDIVHLIIDNILHHFNWFSSTF